MFVLFLHHSDVSSALVVMLVNYAHTPAVSCPEVILCA